MKPRIQSIDILRGLVMVIMALDHTRDMFHLGAFSIHSPLELSTTTPLLFFTRWITHFCAPIFVFLAGTSVFLQGLRKSKKELSIFLIKRGIWLIFIEVFIITLGITFNFNYDVIILQVIWAIGISMVLLGIFIWLPFNAILTIGLIIVLGHNSLDFIEKAHRGSFNFWWDLTHHGHFARYPIGFLNGRLLIILYPFVPWTGLMFLGYCFGKLYQPSFVESKRKRLLIWGGISTVAFFILLRATNIYGDPDAWSIQRNNIFTFLSFINTHKYPPSLLYLCMTIGSGLLFLAWTEKTNNFITRIIIVYGRVPFLYYVVHFYLLHIIRAFFFVFNEGHSIKEGLQGIPGFYFRFMIPGEGYHLITVYAVWIAVVIALYPVCKWFSNYKMTHKNWWLSYL